MKRVFRISFDHQKKGWVVEFPKPKFFGAFLSWEAMKEKGCDEPATFDTASEARSFVKRTGIEEIYVDVSRGMPWENDVSRERAEYERRQKRIEDALLSLAGEKAEA